MAFAPLHLLRREFFHVIRRRLFAVTFFQIAQRDDVPIVRLVIHRNAALPLGIEQILVGLRRRIFVNQLGVVSRHPGRSVKSGPIAARIFALRRIQSVLQPFIAGQEFTLDHDRQFQLGQADDVGLESIGARFGENPFEQFFARRTKMIDLDRRMLLVEFFGQRQRVLRRRARIPNQPVLLFGAFDDPRLPLRWRLTWSAPPRSTSRFCAWRDRQASRPQIDQQS